MGHALFLLLHLAAVVIAPLLLFVTLPLHLVYGAAKRRREAPPTRWSHVKCPDCKELVQKEAAVCKHCGCKLVPASRQTRGTVA